jgi:negative elongation factor B
MALHDADVHEVVDVDPCHKFAWCLDACIRDNTMEPRRVREITSYFDLVKNAEVALG